LRRTFTRGPGSAGRPNALERGAFLGALTWAALGWAGAARPSDLPAGDAGRYGLHGTSHVAGTGLPARDVAADLLAEVGPGRSANEVRVVLVWHAYRCELTAQIAAGDLAFRGGQTCLVELLEPEARGRVEARLTSGRGRLQGGELELELGFELAGALQTHLAARRVTVLGTELEVPDTWMPEFPVSGRVTSSARGRREAP